MTGRRKNGVSKPSRPAWEMFVGLQWVSLVGMPPCANPQKDGYCNACWYCLQRKEHGR